MSPKPSLSLWEYATLPIAISRIIYTLVGACFRAPFRESSGAPTFKRYVLYAGMRAVVENMTIRQFQAINPSTTEAYETVAKRKRFRSDIVKLPDGSLGCWVGDRNAETILVWFHGGGFAYMASTAHVEFLLDVVAQASKHGLSLAVFLLQHDVAPQAQYPRQLEQAVTTIRYLTEDFGKSYSQLLIGGDSAGGNLTIGLLSHLSHPHPTIPALNSHGWNIKGAILLSPWVSLLDLDSQSFRENRPKDGLSGPGLKAWANAFMKPAQRDNYNCPLYATSEWWRDVRAESILVLAGENEILVDQIRQFAEKLKEHNEEEVDILISPGEAHNPPVDERQLGIHGQNGMMENKLCQWILDRT
ncbi:Alpha/Beta hydrolase protein [Annulohypoxylon truncatum]|uniref:Alpha/Beta hydrolase protein n=1 Tax=Annulohypoxylon truncatum TaxID=327061 RepID=UPI00200828D4|nr:Alpha/Beta hydrolase protein [Annulohypoxylon truncatum]KAI1207991.1 Alpha/Beta hydrolase protein [Annulohypoxylon truncatum]